MYEVEKSESKGDKTVETTLRHVKGDKNMSTVFDMRDNKDRRGQTVKRFEVHTDLTGRVIKLHGQSRVVLLSWQKE